MNSVAEYKEWYREHYGHEPSGKLIESFLKMNPRPEPDPTPEEFWEDMPGPELPKFKLVREGT